MRLRRTSNVTALCCCTAISRVRRSKRGVRLSHPFEPHEAAAREQGDSGNRGPGRYYVTLPFEGEFADPAIFCDDDVLGIVERIAGPDPVMCQLATDTPVRGSDFQDWHRDTPPLFDGLPETPSFQLAVNFPLIDVNGRTGRWKPRVGRIGYRVRKRSLVWRMAVFQQNASRCNSAT